MASEARVSTTTASQATVPCIGIAVVHTIASIRQVVEPSRRHPNLEGNPRQDPAGTGAGSVTSAVEARFAMSDSSEETGRLRCRRGDVGRWPPITRRLDRRATPRFRVPRRTNPARACERKVPAWNRDWLVRSSRGPHRVSRCGDHEGLRSNCADRDHRIDRSRSGQP